MNKPAVMFLATVSSSLVILTGLAGLAIRGVTPVYQDFLQFCGLAAETCRTLISSLNPISITAAALLMFLSVVFLWQLVRTLLVVRSVTNVSLPRPNYLEALSLKLGLGGKLKLVPGDYLFCEGLLSPKVVIGAGVLKRLSLRELEAALRHESVHVKNFDPLRVLLSNSLAKGLFFFPLVSDFSKAYSISKEIAADRYAEEKSGRTYLARALYKVLSKSNPDPGVLPALIPSFVSTRSRFDTLVGAEGGMTVSSWSLALSLVSLTLLVSSLFHHAVNLGGCS